jgi:hypothetical protein
LPLDLLDDRLCGRLERQCLVDVLVVDVVANANELAIFVAAAEQNDCDADDLAVGDAGQIRRVGAEEKLVHAHGKRADKDGVEFLVIFVANSRQFLPGQMLWSSGTHDVAEPTYVSFHSRSMQELVEIE